MKTFLLTTALCSTLFAGETNPPATFRANVDPASVLYPVPYAFDTTNPVPCELFDMTYRNEGIALYSTKLTTNVITEWLNIPPITNTVVKMHGREFLELKQIGVLSTNRVLMVFHDDLTNEVVLRNLGRGEWPTERRTVYAPK